MSCVCREICEHKMEKKEEKKEKKEKRNVFIHCSGACIASHLRGDYGCECV